MENLSNILYKQYCECTERAKNEVRRIINNVKNKKITFGKDTILGILVLQRNGEIEEKRCKSIVLIGGEMRFIFDNYSTNEYCILSSEWINILSEVELLKK